MTPPLPLAPQGTPLVPASPEKTPAACEQQKTDHQIIDLLPGSAEHQSSLDLPADHGFAELLRGPYALPKPLDDRSLHLIEEARAHVVRAADALLCDHVDRKCLARPLSDWDRVTQFWSDESIDLLLRLSEPGCPQAPMGACLVAQFRAMVSVILTHHNRWVNWTEATDAAERVVRLSRWIYSGGYAHAIGA
ncbi:hypothetical protein [Catenuloplanes atrovinosus]|uniref:Uncharacterized protein n=1 Tax=Catenuloplanes atrovinosus TaxID=137266 RepID=A0AAE4CB36_9ACTN|nr:hypothetical protein [Catenuloplanes atrovinosus]MDR7277647.1 hypothetical protein [Catenuloplanes atrovinosus]